MTTDCLIVGHNDSQFDKFVEQLKAMGVESGNFRELSLSYLELDGVPHHAMSVLNQFHNDRRTEQVDFHHADFVWAVITNLASKLTAHGLSFDYVKLFQPCKEELKQKLLDDDIRTIAITTTLVVSPEPVKEIVEFIRRYNTTARIVVGGPYIFNQSKTSDEESLRYLFRHLGADFYVISNEGESTLVELIRTLQAEGDLRRVPNLAIAGTDGFSFTERVAEDNSLEENMVDYSLFSSSEIGRFVSLRTAKSCPYRCAFCGHPEIAGKYRYLDIEHVERELDAIKELGSVEALDFVDDTFNVPKHRFKDICRLMIRKNYGFEWISYFRSDQSDEEAIELAAEAGCRGVFLGIESGSDTVLAHMNKTARTKHYRKAIPLLKQAGIQTHANMLVGFPGETVDTVQETIDFIQSTEPDFYRAQLWYCDPTTPIWKKRDEYGIQGAAYNWSHQTMNDSQACDLRERMFLSIDRSTWLPDYAFEVFCVLYLKRKGMSREQVMRYLQCFNTVTSDGLLDPRRKRNGDPVTVSALYDSTRFDAEAGPVVAGDLRRGEAYLRAETYWASALGDPAGSDTPTERALTETAASGDRRLLDLGFVDSTASAVEDNGLIAALAVALRQEDSAHASGDAQAGPALLVGLPAHQNDELQSVLPIRPTWTVGSTLADVSNSVAAQIAEGAPHAWAARLILTRPGIVELHGRSAPRFEAGLWFHGDQRAPDEQVSSSEMAFGARPSFVLHCVRQDSGIALALEYDSRHVDVRAATRLGFAAVGVLRAATEDPTVILDTAGDVDRAATPSTDAVGSFQF
ncbi:MAG: PhpK family radical SAM P-methyltransferase [Myxococcales bacterium]|nr:PhpK family radical SAM P-methyltransferase [Myxococcales bacterium]